MAAGLIVSIHRGDTLVLNGVLRRQTKSLPGSILWSGTALQRNVTFLRPVYSDTTQLNSIQRRDTLTNATQLSPTIGNATDPVEQRTPNQREAGQSS